MPASAGRLRHWWWSRQRRRPTTCHSVVLEPSGVTLAVSESQSVLEAALEAGLPFPHNCRAGICHSCRCQLLAGEIEERRNKSRFARPVDDDDSNTILACQSEPRSDLRVYVEARGNRPITAD